MMFKGLEQRRGKGVFRGHICDRPGKTGREVDAHNQSVDFGVQLGTPPLRLRVDFVMHMPKRHHTSRVHDPAHAPMHFRGVYITLCYASHCIHAPDTQRTVNSYNISPTGNETITSEG